VKSKHFRRAFKCMKMKRKKNRMEMRWRKLAKRATPYRVSYDKLKWRSSSSTESAGRTISIEINNFTFIHSFTVAFLFVSFSCVLHKLVIMCERGLYRKIFSRIGENQYVYVAQHTHFLPLLDEKKKDPFENFHYRLLHYFNTIADWLTKDILYFTG